MMTTQLVLTYVLACVAVVIVPGPSVTVIIANSLRHGARAGLANVAGTQTGLALMAIVLAAGLQVIVTGLGQVFEWLRIIGAAYLIWLGIKLLRSDGAMSAGAARTHSHGSFFMQGLLVVLSNPKVLLFFGAFIPQFVDPASGNAAGQTLLLGFIFVAVAAVLDCGYALLASGAGRWLSRTRVRALEIVSGCLLIGGGLWLALARR